MHLIPEVAVTVSQSVAFLIFVAPLCFYVAWNDLRAMKIPTWSTDALAIVFVVVGLGLAVFGEMSWGDYGWRYVHFIVVLILAMIANAIGAMGAGDSKFLASAAPYVAASDIQIVLFLLAAGLLSGFVVHRLARSLPSVRNLTPEWKSWTDRKRFPMGFPMGFVLVLYLALPLL